MAVRLKRLWKRLSEKPYRGQFSAYRPFDEHFSAAPFYRNQQFD